MNICIDIMGGDNAPRAVLEGVLRVLPELSSDVTLTLYGTEAAFREADSLGLTADKAGRVLCTEVIGYDEAPTAAVRAKKDSSLVRALNDIASGCGDCIVSAGNTGALLTGATLIIKRLPGIKRPALVTVLPTVTGGSIVLLDSGANADCKPEYFPQFAVMGSAYANRILKIETPRIGLLNNGAEAEKGSELSKAAYALLKDSPVHFTGNCEAREALSGSFDVIVTDGFSGNVLLKGIEGTASAMMTMLKSGLMSSLRTKLGALLAKPAFKALKKQLDYTEVGGAPLLGVRAGVIKAHGSSDAKAFAAALRQAVALVRGSVTATIAKALADLPAGE